jgi:uncharacterized protein (DUF697 family)
MTENKSPEKKESPDSIISSHVMFSMVAGSIPVPVVDFVAITAIQVDMLKQLAEYYGKDYNNEQGKSLASSLIGATLSKAGASAIKAIPGVGTVIGITAQVLLAGAGTYALGRVFENHFSGGGTLSSFNTENMKKVYEEYLEKGKQIVKDLKKDAPKDDVFTTIEKLKNMKDSGVISDAEFEKAKSALLEKISG